MDNQTQEFVINGIANSQTKNVHFVDLIIGNLGNPDEAIPFTAVQALTRMGQDAVLRAESALGRLVENANESTRVRAGAKQALQMAH